MAWLPPSPGGNGRLNGKTHVGCGCAVGLGLAAARHHDDRQLAAPRRSAARHPAATPLVPRPADPPAGWPALRSAACWRPRRPASRARRPGWAGRCPAAATRTRPARPPRASASTPARARRTGRSSVARQVPATTCRTDPGDDEHDAQHRQGDGDDRQDPHQHGQHVPVTELRLEPRPLPADGGPRRPRHPGEAQDHHHEGEQQQRDDDDHPRGDHGPGPRLEHLGLRVVPVPGKQAHEGRLDPVVEVGHTGEVGQDVVAVEPHQRASWRTIWSTWVAMMSRMASQPVPHQTPNIATATMALK